MTISWLATLLHALLALLPPVTPGGGGSGAAGERVVTITATDWELAAAGEVPAGTVTLRLHNEGLAIHHAWLVRLDAPHTLRDLERALVVTGRLPAWAVDVGGPGPTPPGGESRVTLRLAPGLHVILCATRLPDGSLAAMKGMYRALAVRAPAADGRAPRPAATLTLTADGGRLEGHLAAGRQVLRVENRTPVAHEVRIYRVGSERAAAALRAWLASEAGPPPLAPVGGVVGLPAGGAAILALRLSPGAHVFVCRPPELRAGAPHPPHDVLRSVPVR